MYLKASKKHPLEGLGGIFSFGFVGFRDFYGKIMFDLFQVSCLQIQVVFIGFNPVFFDYFCIVGDMFVFFLCYLKFRARSQESLP